MAQLTMQERFKQMVRLIRSAIRQFETALETDDWVSIRSTNAELKKILLFINQTPDYKLVLQRELLALHLCFEKLIKQGQQKEKQLAYRLEKFHDQKVGLQAYHEAQGWQ